MDQTLLLLAKLYRLRASVGDVLSPRAAEIFNLPVQVRASLLQERALRIASARKLVEFRDGSGKVAARSVLREAMRSGVSLDQSLNDLTVGLTPRGGKLWERAASPAWSMFVDEGEPKILRKEIWITFEARNLNWLRLLDSSLSRFGFFRGARRRFVKIKSWRPVYWKSFEFGYSLHIDTGLKIDTDSGNQYLRGIAAVDDRLGSFFSVFSGVWDSKWISALVDEK